jgi:phytoene/squalene synthetase
LAIEVARQGMDEDFSLMPWLFPARLQPHVRAFGRFVRLADATADNAFIGREQRIERLAALERALDGESEADWSPEALMVGRALRTSLRTTGVSSRHARDLVRAFRGDVEGRPIKTWTDLMEYCRVAAAPIGRHMLELVGEDVAACARPADALCAALRILRQLRDCEDPSVQYNRLCIPEAYLEDAAVTIRHVRAPSARGQTRAVLDRVLDGVAALLNEAASLPWQVRNRGLRIHIWIVLCRGHKLVARFRERDPLRERVGLSVWQRRRCLWLGILAGFLRWRRGFH